MPPPRHTLVHAAATQVAEFSVEAIGAMVENDALSMLSDASKSDGDTMLIAAPIALATNLVMTCVEIACVGVWWSGGMGKTQEDSVALGFR
nr:hypothetical protein CFP56_27332 [Quercus suber]